LYTEEFSAECREDQLYTSVCLNLSLNFTDEVYTCVKNSSAVYREEVTVLFNNFILNLAFKRIMCICVHSTLYTEVLQLSHMILMMSIKSTKSMFSHFSLFSLFSDKFRCIKCKTVTFRSEKTRWSIIRDWCINEWLKDLLSIPLILQLILFDQNTVHLSWVCTRLSHVNKSSDRKAHDTYSVCNETDAQLIISKYKKNTMKRKERASTEVKKIMCFSLRVLVSN
jgi:hypothetical protein